MASQDNTLRILIAEGSLNDAEMLISVLRNAGHPVRPTQIEDEEDLTGALEDKAFDMFLCSISVDDVPLERAFELIKQSGKDIPIIAITERDDPDERRQAMEFGAIDTVNKNDLSHLKLVVERELKNLNNRRKLRRVEAALRETEKRCHVLLDSSRDAIAYAAEGMHIYANKAYLEKFGVEEFDEIEGFPLLDMTAGADQGKLKEFLKQYSKGNHDNDELELKMVTLQGEEFEASAVFSPATVDGEPCTQILIRDTGNSKELEAQLDTLSKQDLLTGLANRTYFMEQLDRLIADTIDADDGHSSGVLYIQIDNLDNITNTVGITAIDMVISDAAAIIRSKVGDQGLCARFSDEAFTVMLPQIGIHESIAIAEAIRQEIEHHVTETDGKTITTTCTIGAQAITDTSGGAQKVINAAHQASELAREAGGNRVELHASQDETEDSKAAAQAWTQQIEDALATNQFFPVYQPIASLQGDPGQRYEVRVRMKDDKGATLMPNEFLEHTERAGLMAELDRWVIKTSIQALAERKDEEDPTTLFVKLSGPSLEDENLPKFIAEQLKSAGVKGEQLVLQVNEPVAVTQLHQAKHMFATLKKLGCGFSLDHFGSGLNPFQLVKHLPADYLKLDAALTADMSENDETRDQLKQVLDTAHGMNKKVVAAYLEDASSLAMLWQYGADYVQGFFLHGPEPEMNYDFEGMAV